MKNLLFQAFWILNLTITILHAQNQSKQIMQNNDLKSHYLTPITVQGSKIDLYQIGTQINSEFIDKFPTGNGDITSLLKINPNVLFDNSYNSSKTPGEINPSDISINGAMFYQNLYNLDGISMNNDLNPASSNPNSATEVPGHSQGLAIDSSLVGNIQVYDSNVPASYGGFNGGVIDVQTKNPTKNFEAKLSYQTTSSAQAIYHIYPSEYEDFIISTSKDKQPEFFKYFVRGQVEGYISRGFGLIGNFSIAHSTIPLNAYNKTYNKTEQKDQNRTIGNYFLKAVYDGVENLFLEASITYAPQNNSYFIQNTKDSDFSILSGGIQTLFRATYNTPFASFMNTLAYSDLSNSRKAEKNYFKGWNYSASKNWGSPGKGSYEGAWGNILSLQRKIEYKSDVDFEEFHFVSTKHSFSMGIQASYINAFYQRKQEASTGSKLSPIKTGYSCVETDWCSLSPVTDTSKKEWGGNIGQYFQWVTYYQKGKINLDNFAYSFYLQDNINLYRFYLRAGARLDGDTYMDKLTIAPRIAFVYDVLGEESTWRLKLIGGYNRYYGRNISAYRLADGRNSLNVTYKRKSPSTALENSVVEIQKNNTIFRTLKIPYDDEFMGGITQKLWNFELTFKYIKRQGKDQITKVSSKIASLPSQPGLSPLYFGYSNSGKTSSDIFSFTLNTTSPIEFFSTSHILLLGADYSSIKRNYVDYDSPLNAGQFEDSDIIFEGKLIKYSQLPADNFAKPWSMRLTTISQGRIRNFHITWTNFFSYASGYRSIVSTGTQTTSKGEKLTEYKIYAYPYTFNWDTRIGLNARLWGKNIIFINLDIYNLLDNINIQSVKTTTSKGTKIYTPSYELGRSFWIQAGYQF